MDSSDESKKNFFKHVFNFDDASKAEVLNIVQYAVLAIIPVVLLNKSIQKYVPEADDIKGSLELLAEIVIQVLVMFIGLLLVHRMVTFLPTYSTVPYPDFSLVFIILAVLMITLSLQTKLGEKVSILTDRLMELWDGSSDKKKKGNVKVSQPISQNGVVMQSALNSAGTQQYADGTSINSLPMGSTQQLPNYDNMHQRNPTPLVNAASPTMEAMQPMEPIAANDALGGSFSGFSSW